MEAELPGPGGLTADPLPTRADSTSYCPRRRNGSLFALPPAAGVAEDLSAREAWASRHFVTRPSLPIER